MARSRKATKVNPRRSKKKLTPKSRNLGAKSPRTRRSAPKKFNRGRGRVRIVRSRASRAKKPSRPLPPAESLNERMFLGSLERSLRDHRSLWEALAKR